MGEIDFTARLLAATPGQFVPNTVHGVLLDASNEAGPKGNRMGLVAGLIDLVGGLLHLLLGGL